MRKHATRLAGALLAAAVAVVGFGFAPTDALAKKADEGYTYTVRIYAGAEGDIGGKTCYEVPGLAENGVVNFDPQGDVNVFDSDRYYVRGIRVSGEDDVIYSTATAIPVDGDADYVVAYGVKSKSQVAYVARYVDASGQQIADDSPTYYGNEGDAPVVAATYVAGYEPRAASLQQELTGGSTNVFTFVYDAIPENVVTTTVTETTVTTTTEAAAAAPAAAAAAPAAAAAAPAAAAAAPAAAAPAAGAAAAATPGAAGGETIGGNATPTAGPNATTGNGNGNGTTGNGTQSIPNEPGPTSGPQTTTTAAQGVPMPMLVIGALAVIGAIAAIATRLTSKDAE